MGGELLAHPYAPPCKPCRRPSGAGYSRKEGDPQGKVSLSSISLRSVGPRQVARHATRPWHSMPLVAGVTHMAVTRLRTRRDAEKQATLEAVRNMLGNVAGVEDVVAFVERRLAADRGWKFIMVEPRLYA